MDSELEIHDEMMLEFDKSAYNMNSGEFYSTVYIAPEQNSDDSLSETDVTIYSTPLSSQIQPPQLQNINERVHTPARIYKSPYQPRNQLYFSNDV